MPVHAQRHHMCSKRFAMQLCIPEETSTGKSCQLCQSRQSRRPEKEGLEFERMCKVQSFSTEGLTAIAAMRASRGFPCKAWHHLGRCCALDMHGASVCSFSTSSGSHELLALWNLFIPWPKRCPVPLGRSAKGALRCGLPPCLIPDMHASNLTALQSNSRSCRSAPRICNTTCPIF